MNAAVRATIAEAMTTKEGFFPGSLAWRNNNPGNLRYVGQRGARQGEGGFAFFPSPEAGAAALESQIELDASRGATLATFVYKYAPPKENQTSQYLAFVQERTGYDPDIPLNDLAAGDDFTAGDEFTAAGLNLSPGAMMAAGVVAAALVYVAFRR